MTTCPRCQQPRWYISQYDSYACLNCRVWLEPACDCGECPHDTRPPAPLAQFSTSSGYLTPGDGNSSTWTAA